MLGFCYWSKVGFLGQFYCFSSRLVFVQSGIEWGFYITKIFQKMWPRNDFGLAPGHDLHKHRCNGITCKWLWFVGYWLLVWLLSVHKEEFRCLLVEKNMVIVNSRVFLWNNWKYAANVSTWSLKCIALQTRLPWLASLCQRSGQKVLITKS